MKQLLDNYIFSDALRYENHRMIYDTGTENRTEIGGFPAAAVLGALLYGQDEGRERGIFVTDPNGRKEFIRRYEDETLHENGGMFKTEVQALSEAYMEFNGDMNILLAICGNERLYDLAFGMMVEYMEQLVKEQVYEHIYELCEWREPFAQWLFDAGYIETNRQHLLSIDWTDAAIVCGLAEEIEKSPTLETSNPSFLFDGERAEDLLNGYYNWLMASVEQEAALYPDANVQLAAFKTKVLQYETDYDFLKPEMKSFTPDQLNLFRKWMNQWIHFLQEKIQPVNPKKKDIRQEFLLDDVQPVPQERNYVQLREYIFERCKYDKKFEKAFKDKKRTDFCDQLSLLFGWFVDPNALGKRLNKKSKK